MHDNTVELTTELRHQAASTALELVELVRYANATREIDSNIVTANDAQSVTLGMVCALEASMTIAGGGDFDLGVARTRDILVSLIARQAQESDDE